MSEYRFDDFVDNLVEVLLFDAPEPTGYVAFDIARDDLTFDEARLREGEARHHVVGQRVGILRIDAVVRGDEDEVKHPLFVNLQLVA